VIGLRTAADHGDLRATCDAIRERVPLSAIAAGSLKLLRAGREWKARCPFHEDRTPSFTIYADDRRFMCFGCGAQGDVLDFVMKAQGLGLRDAIALIDSGGMPLVKHCRADREPQAERDRRAEALAIWNGAVAVPGTSAETYLRSRGLKLPIPTSIRFARLALGRFASMPVLVTAVSSLAGEITGIQRTFLLEDGTGKATFAGGKAKLSLGKIRGGAIRLAPAADELIVTGGLEDALTLQQELGRPAWAATGETMIALVALPDVVRSVIIGADNDAAGEYAAMRAAERFALQGRQVRIMRPRPPHKDFHAQLRATRV
jgi:DNA primase